MYDFTAFMGAHPLSMGAQVIYAMSMGTAANTRAKAARPVLLDAKLSAERDVNQKCHRCGAGEAAIRCLDCAPLDMEFLCGGCDMEAHKQNVFHVGLSLL